MIEKLTKLLCFLLVTVSQPLLGQLAQPNASEIELSLKKLNTLGSVLYVAAHPDDENTRLIAYMSNDALLNTAYLSVTRGDGGQNLIGPEIRELLGVIRTQELLQARGVDGGQQFFTRANDFGYSKNPEETFKVWDKQQVLSDVVWVIRNFQPDIIITRFPTDGRGGHGHHTASAILAEEAFDAAADPNRFPEQLQYVKPWQARSLLFNASWWFYRGQENFDPEDKIAIDVGAYNYLLGQSYSEISARSRSMHKSQGFGTAGTRGSEIEYLEYVKGEKLPMDVFKAPLKQWDEISGGEVLSELFSKAYQEFNPERPFDILPILMDARDKLQYLEDPYWKAVKLRQLDQIIAASMGLYLEASTTETSATPGEEIVIRLEATNRSPHAVRLKAIGIKDPEFPLKGEELQNNLRFTKELTIKVPDNQPFSQPYWLKSTGSLGMFEVSDQQMIGKPENAPAISIPFELEISGRLLTYQVPLIHKSSDPVKGEVRQPLAIVPPVTINFGDKVQVFADEAPRKLEVSLKSGINQVEGELKIQVPDGWGVTPESIPFTIDQKGEEQKLTFTLTPPRQSGEGKVKAVAVIGSKEYSLERVSIEYDHIPHQVLFPEAAAKVVKLNIVAGGQNIGYIMGAGDDIPNSLRQIGYSVELLNSDEITPVSLSGYNVVILGIRALNTNERLKFQMPSLLSYVEQGGTLIVQYNTSHRLVTDDFAPFPLELSRDRVSVENAPVEFLLPEHQVLNYPNKITGEDFEGWVQERGLYFPRQWDPSYQAIITTNDPGETPKHGGLLVTQFGKGHYVYSGLSWFRELPAGVPGAYRLFANIISLGQGAPDN